MKRNILLLLGVIAIIGTVMAAVAITGFSRSSTDVAVYEKVPERLALVIWESVPENEVDQQRVTVTAQNILIEHLKPTNQEGLVAIMSEQSYLISRGEFQALWDAVNRESFFKERAIYDSEDDSPAFMRVTITSVDGVLFETYLSGSSAKMPDPLVRVTDAVNALLEGRTARRVGSSIAR